MQRWYWSIAAVHDSSFAMQSGAHEGNVAVTAAHGRTSMGVGGWLFDQPYLLLSLTSLFWAANTILGRFIVGHVPPVTCSLSSAGAAPS